MLLLMMCLLLLVVCNSDITVAPNIFIPFSRQLKIDSVHCVDSISTYSSDHIMLYFTLPEWRNNGIGIQSVVDTSKDTTFLSFMLNVGRDTSIILSNWTVPDSFEFNIFQDTIMHKRLWKYLSIGDSINEKIKTVIITDTLIAPLPILTDKEIPSIIYQFKKTCVLCVEKRYCRPCVEFRPTYLNAANIYSDSGMNFYFVVAEKSEQFLKEFNISAIPTCIIIDTFKICHSIIGAVDSSIVSLELSDILHSK